jgi:hypothetical protein
MKTMLVAMVLVAGCGGRALEMPPCGGISQECCTNAANPCEEGMACMPAACPPRSTCDDGTFNSGYATRFFLICDAKGQ